MTDQAAPPRASFRSFEESTRDDWMLIMSQRGELEAALPDRILEQFGHLRNDYGGFPVDRLEHSLQTATRAERAGGGCPADSVMDVWVDKEVEGLGEYPFGLDQIIPDCLLLLDGGAETTRTVIARTLVELTRRPEQFQLLADGADLTVAVEEFIRWVTPIHNMCRIATEDVEFGDVTVGAGQQVVLMYSSANRDPVHFDDPESFEVTRQPNHHLAFGHGTHFCLGAALARLEIRVFFEEFVRRFRNPRLAPGTEPVEMPNAFVHGLREAHLVVDPA